MSSQGEPLGSVGHEAAMLLSGLREWWEANGGSINIDSQLGKFKKISLEGLH